MSLNTITELRELMSDGYSSKDEHLLMIDEILRTRGFYLKVDGIPAPRKYSNQLDNIVSQVLYKRIFTEPYVFLQTFFSESTQWTVEFIDYSRKTTLSHDYYVSWLNFKNSPWMQLEQSQSCYIRFIKKDKLVINTNYNLEREQTLSQIKNRVKKIAENLRPDPEYNTFSEGHKFMIFLKEVGVYTAKHNSWEISKENLAEFINNTNIIYEHKDLDDLIVINSLMTKLSRAYDRLPPSVNRYIETELTKIQKDRIELRKMQISLVNFIGM